MSLPLPRPDAPMEALLVNDIPAGAEWEYEPKWDGFRHHFTGGRFRHGTKLLRWRPDKTPEQCRMDHVLSAGKGPLEVLGSSQSR